MGRKNAGLLICSGLLFLFLWKVNNKNGLILTNIYCQQIKVGLVVLAIYVLTSRKLTSQNGCTLLHEKKIRRKKKKERERILWDL